MHFTPVLALAGLAAAAPHYTNNTLLARNETGLPVPPPAGLPAGLKYRRGQTYFNATAPMCAEVSNLSVQEKLVGNTPEVESIASIYFNLNGNITCTAQNPGTDGAIFACGSTPYSFGLVDGTSTDFALELYLAAEASYVSLLGFGLTS